MRPQQIIARKRDGGELFADEIKSFIDGVCDKSWADYQISALVMAMFINGLSDAEGEMLTRSMLYSGEVLDFSDIEMPKADKHSTGGVGDKTSLIIAPLVASCGVAVPMISGRGLGHTGGTLDKLESIPGYNVRLSTDQFREIIRKCGFAMASQTADIAPADKKIYELRDATATVPYIPLIVASIMSKKLAEGLAALVLDVKTGSGAFMEKPEDAVKLAEALVQTGTKFGVRTQAVVSDMNQPLGKHVGNSLEVYECVKILRNEIEAATRPTWELSLELAARILALSGIASDLESAKRLAVSKLESGDALERFRLNVVLQGGDASIFDQPEKLKDRNISEFEITSPSSGFIAAIDTMAIGNAVCEIGGGRTKSDDILDHAVGFASEINAGDEIRQGDTIGIVYCRSEEQAYSIHSKLLNSYKINHESSRTKHLLIKEVIG